MINIEFTQQVLGAVVTLSSIIIGIVKHQSISTIENNAIDVIKFVDRHYADKNSEIKKMRFINTVRNMVINKVPKGLKWLVKYIISDKNIEKILNLQFTNYKNENKVFDTIENTQNLISNQLDLIGTDINVPSYDFERLETKSKGNFYTELGYRDNFKDDRELLTKAGVTLNF